MPSLQEWINSIDTSKYKGKLLAIHKELGIVTFGDNYQEVIDNLDKIGINDRCIVISIPKLPRASSRI